MSYPEAKGNTGVPPVLASGHPDRCKSLVGGTPATRHSRDGQVPLHEKAVAPDGFVFSSMVIIGVYDLEQHFDAATTSARLPAGSILS